MIVEALRNICGVTLLIGGYQDYEEFNLKKFQAKHSTVESSLPLSTSTEQSSSMKIDNNSVDSPQDEADNNLEDSSRLDKDDNSENDGNEIDCKDENSAGDDADDGNDVALDESNVDEI